MLRDRLVDLSCASLLAIAATGCADFGSTQEPATGALTPVTMRGAIFTTTVDGSRVNANLYDAKPDVYLDGGPGVNAPPKAASLPAGDYYFQVTDPSGKTLLSSDAITCRRFHVSENGVIDAVVPAGGCEHATGVDNDQAALGAITVQLMPFDDTPNKGGEYKVWATAVASYGMGPDRTHGFAPRDSKTDNFKVRFAPPPPPPPLVVCGDGIVEDGEQCDDGNTVDGDGCSSTCTIEACCGDGIVEPGEECDDGNNTSGDGCSADCHVELQHPGA